MKTEYLCLLGLLFGGSAHALPVLNMNTGGAETVTIFPDHQNPNLFYIGPTVMTVTKGAGGAPQFSYVEYSQDWSRRAVIQTTMRSDFSFAELVRAKQEVLKLHPQAQFAALPFQKTKVEFSNSLSVLLEQSDCSHQAGTVADEQTCVFRLTHKGVHVLLPMLKKGLSITTQFVYTIGGVVQLANGSYTERENTYQVAGRIGGPELAAHPELFLDKDGDVIERMEEWQGEGLGNEAF